MGDKGLTSFFENFLASKSLFRDKRALQSAYVPESVKHRDEQIQQIAELLAPCLRLEKPSNLFIYGKTGSGKTLTAKHVTSQIANVAGQRELKLKIIYINCKLKKIAQTEYRLVAELARAFGRAIPPTGLPTDEVYKLFFDVLDEAGVLLVLILDEIDQLVKKAGDEVLYSLTRINSELRNSQITLIGISNDLMFTDELDPRVKSSLSEEEIVFPPYNAMQIQEILKERAALAFQPDLLLTGVIEKCAAFAAREHGDARRALELLRVAGEIAEREGEKKVDISHLDKAEEKIEKDRVTDIITTQPKQFKAVLYAILSIKKKHTDTIFTGEVYDFYRSLCVKCSLRPLTQRRVSDVIGELDMLGIINAKVISKGRYGRTREINVTAHISPNIVSILEDGLDLA